MAKLNTRANALTMQISGVDVVHLDTVGTIPGVYIESIAARNGPGVGYLRSNGQSIQWKAPSGAYGNAVLCAVDDATYMLEDGLDPNKWCRITVATAFISSGIRESKVLIRDVWNNGIGHDDVTAGEATAGDVTAYEITLKNNSGLTLKTLAFWLDGGVSGLELSEDGAAWSSPTTEATGIAFPDLAAAGTDILHARRTIGAGASADPKILNDIRSRYYGSW